MTDADLAVIESTLATELPVFYRLFLIQHADELRSISTIIPTRSILDYTPEAIIYHNRLARDDEWAYRKSPLPSNLFVVGLHACDDYFFVKLDGSDEAVWAAYRDIGSFDQEADSLGGFLERLREDAKDPDKWQHPVN
ncbi:MAG TPA: SMI1/KNR4 family protein [Gemmatales bacterium]|nr:SMI1/KNR4 family protein [Gemmatales bacterium]HMP59604.1 SMI1/KNR4 family protein [Gemmatales bacterium]